MKAGVYLETGRLCIRDHVWSDLETHHQLYSDLEAMYYLPGIMTTSMEASEENLKVAIEEIKYSKRTQYFFRIEDKVTHEHIGEIGYTVTDCTPVGKCAELGYFSYKKCWNKGYMSEATKAVLHFAFEENDVYRMSSGCIKTNKGSERVMQKCGLIKEGEFKQKQWHEGQMRDRVEYGILKNEWGKQEHIQINSLYICVNDMKRAIHFYEVLLNQKVTEEDEIYSVFNISGFRLGLFAYEKMKEKHTYGNSCLPSLAVTDIKKIQERLQYL